MCIFAAENTDCNSPGGDPDRPAAGQGGDLRKQNGPRAKRQRLTGPQRTIAHPNEMLECICNGPLQIRVMITRILMGAEEKRARARAQYLVATRLLEYSHHPVRRPSRLQGSRPGARRNYKAPDAPPSFHGGPIGFEGSRPRPIRIRVRRAGGHPPVPAWILT
jgi:hypothetical protein